MGQHRLCLSFVRFQLSNLLVCAIALHARVVFSEEPGGRFVKVVTDVRSAIEAAKERAPEVVRARTALKSSRSSRENGRLAPFGNPHLEVTAQGANQGVIKDVAVAGELWLPVETYGQSTGRRREAEGFVAMYESFVEQARAQAAARAVLAYGRAAVAKERAAVLRTLVDNEREQADMLSERMARGDAIQRDVSLAAAEVARHQALLTENGARLIRAESELAELTGEEVPAAFAPLVPPSLASNRQPSSGLRALPQARAFTAEARYHEAAAERWQREGRGMLNFGLVGGRGDYGETRIGGGIAYSIPFFAPIVRKRFENKPRAREHVQIVLCIKSLRNAGWTHCNANKSRSSRRCPSSRIPQFRRPALP